MAKKQVKSKTPVASKRRCLAKDKGSAKTSALYSSRLELLGELNQLITSGLSLEKLLKALVRSAAFHLSASVALGYLLDDERTELQLRGCFGAVQNNLPPSIPLTESLFAQFVSLGGIASVSDVSAPSAQGLQFLSSVGVVSAHCVPIQTLSDCLGLFLIGFTEQRPLASDDVVLLEEFSRGAAAAVAHAVTQQQLSSYTDHLETLVQQRTREVEKERLRAEEASLAKSTFIASISHELRTPLTAVVAYSTMLADGMLGPVSDKQKESLGAISRSSEHLKELIDDVLSISRIEAGKTTAQPEEVLLGPLLHYVHKMLLQGAMQKEVKLQSLVLSEELAKTKLFVDPRHTRQILLNILGNAIKYTPKGGRVELCTKLAGDKAVVSVIDSGIGMSPEELARIFSPYERGSSFYSCSQSGAGMGLAIAKQLIELNGGSIHVESEAGRGSKFSIILPRSHTTDATLTTGEIVEKQQVQHQLNGLRLLVVDDHPATCEILHILLSGVGGEVQVAHSIQQARALADDKTFDVIILDLAFPGESGFDLLHGLRRNPQSASSTTPVIILSACVFQDEQTRATKEGASSFVAKPFQPTELLETIRKVTISHALEVK